MEKTFDKINYAKLVRRIFLVLFDIIFINLSSFLVFLHCLYALNSILSLLKNPDL